MQTFKQRLASGELIRTFAIGRMAQPLMIEMFGLAGGYHGFWLDQEHASLTTDQMLSLSLAARANHFDSFVRLAPTGYSQVTQCMEAGMGGVMAAQIHSADQAREFVSWARFAPLGTRGLNASGYDARYTHTPPKDFVERANRDTFIAIQIETLGSVEQAQEIASLDGVDLLFVGPADLSLALGVVGQFDHDKLWEAIGRVRDACRAHGKAWGCVAPNPAFANRAIENECRMPTMGNDVVILRRGIEAVQQAYAQQFSGDDSQGKPR